MTGTIPCKLAIMCQYKLNCTQMCVHTAIATTTQVHPSTGTHACPAHHEGHAEVLPASLLSGLGLCTTPSHKGQLQAALPSSPRQLQPLGGMVEGRLEGGRRGEPTGSTFHSSCVPLVAPATLSRAFVVPASTGQSCLFPLSL